MYPDFICIGAQKAGTTWLHHNLRQHPQIWLPPVKELHYLDHKPPSLYKRLFGKPAHLREARLHLKKTLISFPACASLDDLRWALRYSLGRRNDRWYASLFPKLDGRLTGEVCPGYARMTEAQVCELHTKMPDARIIYLLRNPVDRAWSTTVMHFNKPKYGGIEKADDEQILAHVADQRTQRHSDYLSNLAAWEHSYGDNFYVGFFDELQLDPVSFLRGVLDFLGVNSGAGMIPEGVDRKVNKGTVETVPARFRPLLWDLYGEQIAGLHEKYRKAYTEKWLKAGPDGA